MILSKARTIQRDLPRPYMITTSPIWTKCEHMLGAGISANGFMFPSRACRIQSLTANFQNHGQFCPNMQNVLEDVCVQIGSITPSKHAQYKPSKANFMNHGQFCPDVQNVLEDVYVRIGSIIPSKHAQYKSLTANFMNNGQFCPDVQDVLEDASMCDWGPCIIPSKSCRIQPDRSRLCMIRTMDNLAQMLKCSGKTYLWQWSPLFHLRMQNSAGSFTALHEEKHGRICPKC